MNHIDITHNPFTVETQFLLNGKIPAENCKLSSYKESRLQVWIEHLFDDLSNLFNGETNFEINFRGVESDYLDIEEAAKTAQNKGMTVRVRHQMAQPIESRLARIHQLMRTAQEHPKFGTYLHNNDEVRRSFDESFNRDFDVYVVATMSAGKSTLINAMLGCDLLPARNEATTATIARITDNESMAGRFSAKRFDKNNTVIEQTDNATLPLIDDWNRKPDTYRMDIEGNIVAVKERDNVRLVLTDTPGPNNSQNDDHERTTMGFIQDSRRSPLVLYVLNGTQLGTTDDSNLLKLVAKIMGQGGKQSRDRFIFVINKMDAFDPENGEDLPQVLSRARDYLEANGIQNPAIYPVSANLTRLIRKPSDQYTRSERGDFAKMADLFEHVPSMDMLQYMPITSKVRRALDSKNYSTLHKSSGLPAVEAMIDEHIDKYNLPHRVNRAYDVLKKAIEIGLEEVSLIESFKEQEQELNHIHQELEALQKRQEKSFDTDAYKDKIEREGKALPLQVEQALTKLGKENKAVFLKMEDKLQGSMPHMKANQAIKEAEEHLRFHFSTLINEYEKTFQNSQEAITRDLKEEYQRYVADLFQGCADLNLPVLEGIRQSVAHIPLNLEVQPQDVKTREVIDSTWEVSTSTWYKPWSWGKKETRHSYVKEEFIDLADFWSERKGLIKGEFEQLTKAARQTIEQSKNTLIEQYLMFMNREFNEKFTHLIESIKFKMTDLKAREEALEEARQLLDWIQDFKNELETTLAV